MNQLRIALAQINTTVGDMAGNEHKIREGIRRARAMSVDIVVFPELAIPGYPPEDLLLKPEFIAANVDCLNRLAPDSQGITAVVGFVDWDDDIYNAAAVLHDGQLAGVYHKAHLPNYGVFDEDRYFQAGNEVPVVVLGEATVGVSVCEDIWHPAGPPEVQSLIGGAHLLINISASPYHAGKGRLRERMLGTRASDNVAVVALCNLVGGQDELVFDGNSVIFDERGRLIARGRQFEEDFVVADLNLWSVFRRRLHDPRRRQEQRAFRSGGGSVRRVPLSDLGAPTDRPPIVATKAERLGPVEEVYRALVLGTHDYVRKNGFQKVVIALSGGIDSSLTAAVAADALGPENVTGVAMPSRYNAPESHIDAEQLAKNLGINFLTVPIDEVFQTYLDTLEDVFAGLEPDVAEENIQARVRGNILMALSNKFGWLVLTTGNKSEMSVGYATLYGDMAGGFAVIKDVPKTLVYELSRYRNEEREIIPQRVLDKEPSAELRPNQRDTDSLPPYDVLDPVLKAYVEEDRSPAEIEAMGFDAELVHRVIHMVDRNEYKRRQGPPGVKITPRAFGKDRRLPITNRFRVG